MPFFKMFSTALSEIAALFFERGFAVAHAGLRAVTQLLDHSGGDFHGDLSSELPDSAEDRRL